MLKWVSKVLKMRESVKSDKIGVEGAAGAKSVKDTEV